MSNRYTGTIKKITDKGYGFITCEDLKKDVFFHVKGLMQGVNMLDLQEGDAVEFDTEEGPKGTAAIGVAPISQV